MWKRINKMDIKILPLWMNPIARKKVWDILDDVFSDDYVVEKLGYTTAEYLGDGIYLIFTRIRHKKQDAYDSYDGKGDFKEEYKKHEWKYRTCARVRYDLRNMRVALIDFGWKIDKFLSLSNEKNE